MYVIPVWLGIFFGALILVAGIGRYRQRRAVARQPALVVDEAAIRQIIERGSLSTDEEEPLDEVAIRRAEEEFWAQSEKKLWDQSWEEPERYGG